MLKTVLNHSMSNCITEVLKTLKQRWMSNPKCITILVSQNNINLKKDYKANKIILSLPNK